MAKEIVDTLDSIVLRLRKELLRELAKHSIDIEAEYRKAAKSLTSRLKQSSPAMVELEVMRKMRQTHRRIIPLLEKAVRDGVIQGNDAAVEQYKKLFDRKTAPGFPTRATQMALASQRIRGRVYVDKVSLSSRLWRKHRELGGKMAVQIQQTIRAGKSMVSIADEIIGYTDRFWHKNPPDIQIPKYIADLRDAAKDASLAGETNLLDDALKKYRGQIEKLGQAPEGFSFTVRPATKQFVKDIQNATPDQIDKHVERWAVDRARTHARMIARTETVNAYRQSYYNAQKDKDWVKGIRWNLAGSHPKPDICDVWASQDSYGLGPGGYPIDSVPSGHPNCMCYQTSIIDEDSTKREIARLKGEPLPEKKWLSGKKETSGEWLKKQPVGLQKEILGPTRHKAFKKDPDAVFKREPKGGGKQLKRVRDLKK